jgi:hypothetical protein
MALLALLLFTGCQKPEIVEVRCISVHYYGDTLNKTGVWNERLTCMVTERLDTHERRSFVKVYGAVNDVFAMDWNDPHY